MKALRFRDWCGHGDRVRDPAGEARRHPARDACEVPPMPKRIIIRRSPVT